jgi:ribosome maturation protein SDO1
VGVMTFPAGMQNDFYDLVNEHTSGEADTRIIKDEDDLTSRR